MMIGKKIWCAAGALILSASILSQAVSGVQGDSADRSFGSAVEEDTAISGSDNGVSTQTGGQTIDPGAMLKDTFDLVRETVDEYTVPDFEGNLHVAAADGLRDAIADHYRSEDDMSWIQDADLFLQGTANDSGGVDLEATLFFNGTELYHLQVSFDRENNILYLECPELKQQVFAFPIGDFRADAQTITGKKITPEKLAEYTSVLKEFNDLIKSISLDTLRAEWTKYLTALGGYIRTEKGFAPVTAGSLKTEGNATTWTIPAEDLAQLIPTALKMLSEDALLEQIMESPFAEHVFRLALGGKASKLLPNGALWQFTQQAILQAAEKDFVKGRSVSAMLVLDQYLVPIHLSASMEKSGMKADLFSVSAIVDGANHAFEGKVGPMVLKAAHIKTNQSFGLVIQGSLKDDILKEAVSVHWNGSTMPVLMIRNLDLLAIRDAWLSGEITAVWNDLEYSCDFFTDEDGLRTMRFLVNGKEWFTLTADLRTVESTTLDEFDVSDAFLVDSRKAFFKYMRDASAIRMFEKLSSASVPQEYVDMLTDGEAATESSRENTVEMEE